MNMARKNICGFNNKAPNSEMKLEKKNAAKNYLNYSCIFFNIHVTLEGKRGREKEGEETEKLTGDVQERE